MTKLMIPLDEIAEENVDATAEMKSLSNQAILFLTSFSWCKEIMNGYLAWGFPKLGIFLFHVRAEEGNVWTWVIVGSVPPAYLDFELCPNAFQALEGYIGEFKEWVYRARKGESVDGLMPVYDQQSFRPLPPTLERAIDLDRRLEFIHHSILTEYKEDLIANRYRKD